MSRNESLGFSWEEAERVAREEGEVFDYYSLSPEIERTNLDSEVGRAYGQPVTVGDMVQDTGEGSWMSGKAPRSHSPTEGRRREGGFPGRSARTRRLGMVFWVVLGVVCWGGWQALMGGR